MAAMQARDVQTCSHYMATEYILISAQGTVVPREQWLENIQHMTFEWYELGSMDIEVTGNTALVRASWKQRATFYGQPWDLDGDVIDVWIKRDHRWQVAMRYARPLPGAV